MSSKINSVSESVHLDVQPQATDDACECKDNDCVVTKAKRKGRGLRRMFDHGDLRIMMLAHIHQKPSYGYELIKSISSLTCGLYTPSPGVIYPKLNLLEESGLVISEETQKGRKCYELTMDGKVYLDENCHLLQLISKKLEGARGMRRGALLSDDIEQALGKLRALLRHKLVTSELDETRLSRIAMILNEAVERIEEINMVLSSENT